MSDRLQAQKALEIAYPGRPIKAWTMFGELYLFRVEHSSPLEQDWDPFFSVDPLTFEVRDFSVLTDITSKDFSELKWNDI